MNKSLGKILSSLTLSDAEKTTKDILQSYEKKGSSLIHFLYFANIILNSLDKDSTSPEKESLKKALLSGDFLLPDGIALKLLYKKHFGKELPNLNGTDFLTYFLAHLPKDKKVEILLYGSTKKTIDLSSEYITRTFEYSVVSAQNGFEEFDWGGMEPKKEGIIRIFLIARGTPRQEVWAEENRKKIEEKNCLVFTVGGLLDFWAGTEKRAPEWMRKMNIEWLYRALSNPRKNLKKTLVSLQLIRFLMEK
ncbi:TPA: hypothetical protein DCZ36_02440 [Candidatus Gracilibacteria bacterium]|nr:hypothetical protein [Candidatus Gracilibacteria bacterium]